MCCAGEKKTISLLQGNRRGKGYTEFLLALRLCKCVNLNFSMMKKLLLGKIVILALLLSGCRQPAEELADVLTINVREGLEDVKKSISLDDDIENIAYIPLETTDSSLVSNVLDLRISEQYIFIYNGRTSEVMQFDKEGRFVQKIGREGNGPGEYFLVKELGLDEKKNQLFIFQEGGAPLVYSFSGDYLYSDTTMNHAGGLLTFDNGSKALKGLAMSPIQNALWAGALMDGEGRLVESKCFYSSAKETQRDVYYMREINFSPFNENVLLSVPHNDTVYSMSLSGIRPRYVMNRLNEAIYYSAVCDITKRNDEALNASGVIDFADMFETYQSLYVRLRKGDDYYVLRYNKYNKSLESYLVPTDFLGCSEAIPGNNVIGVGHELTCGIPFWPEFYVKPGVRAQVVSAYALEGLKQKGYLQNVPAVLDLGENDNPVIVVYTFRKQ